MQKTPRRTTSLNIWVATAALTLLSSCGQVASSLTSIDSGRAPSSDPGQSGIGGTSPSLDPTPVPRSSEEKNISVCAEGSITKGLDVSDYEVGTQWSVVQHSGDSFAYVKATEGVTFVSDQFAIDWPATKSAGLLRGAYHFFHPKDDPIQQAQFYLATVGSNLPGDLPPMLDWEESDGASAALQIQNALIWLQTVEKATGKIPVVYVDPSYWNDLGNPIQFARYPLFIANYSVSCPSIPPPWSKWVFWQHTIGTQDGIESGDADLDDFNGDAASMAAFATTEIF